MEKQAEFAFTYSNAVKGAVEEQLKTFNKMMASYDPLNPVLDNIRAGQFIVGSFSIPGGLYFSPSPSIHTTAEAARAECKRLATKIPGKLYLFVKLCGGEVVPTTQSISV